MSDSRHLTIGVLNGNGVAGDAFERRRTLAQRIATAPDSDLLVLPYLAAYPPFWQVIDRAVGFAFGEREPFPSITSLLPEINKRGIPVLTTAFEVVAEGVFYASAVLVEPSGDARVIYRQEHALNERGCFERLYFQPGVNVTPPIFELGGLKFGLMLGGDLWVPECARSLRIIGANAFLSLAALGESMKASGRTLSQARALENGVPVIFNDGQSTVGEGNATRKLTSNSIGDWSLIRFNAFEADSPVEYHDPMQMRRPRLYQSLVKTWQESGG
ncbi:hypothetical protein BH09CHL1_BH09CHL1_24070 [soil metagenome]